MAIRVGDAVMMITVNEGSFLTGMNRVNITMDEFKKRQEAAMKKIGIAMVGMGTAIFASLAMSIKAAAEEQVGIERLRVAMNNVGLAYDGATGSVEKWIDALQQSTAFADDQIRMALSALIPETGSLTKAQELLGIATDVARWKDMDLVSAAEMLGKVYGGNIGILARSNIIVKEGSTAIEALAQVQKMAADQAEAYAKTTAGQMELLKNNVNDVAEAIGTTLLENLTGLVTKLNEAIQAIKEWITKNPEITLGLTLFAFALGLVLLGFGTFILLAPGIAAAGSLIGGGIAAALGPIGWVILAIAALIAIGIALWKNWDKIVDFFTGSHREMTKVAIEELKKQTEAQKAALKAQGKANEDANTKAIADLKKKYGVLEGYTKQEDKNLMQLAKDASAARGREIDAELTAIGRAHDQKMRMIDEEYNAKIDALDAETNAAIGALEGQLSAMDAEDKATARSTEDQADYKRLQQIQNAITNSTNLFEQMRAQKDLDAFNLEMADKQKDRARTDKRESIQSQIAALREAAANQKEALQNEYNAKVTQENELYNIKKGNLENEKNGLEEALQAELIRLETERQAYEKAENDKLAALQTSLALQDTALQAFHDKEMGRIAERASAGAVTSTTSTTKKSWWQKLLAGEYASAPGEFKTFQGFEGRIPGIPGTPIPAIVHAGEYIGQGGGNTEAIRAAIRDGLAGMVITVNVGGQDVAAVISREQYRMQQVRHG